MLRAAITTTFDDEALRQRLKNKADKAQKKLDRLVLDDSNYFVHVDTGALRDSAIEATAIGSGQVEWRTPYARRRYYEGPVGSTRNPDATPRWFETAKARYVRYWTEVVREVF